MNQRVTKIIDNKISKHINLRYIIPGLLLIAQPLLAAESLPNHDIVVFDINENSQGITLSSPQVIANSPGYDNQPYFAENGQDIFYTRIENGNADIWQWKANSKSSHAIAATSLSEYSPTVIPFETSSLSTVRVEKDGTQRLWEVDQAGKYSVIFQDVKPVGYHAWSDKNIAMFVLGEPHELHISEFGNSSSKVVDKDIGRCLQKVPGKDAVSYTVNQNDMVRLKVYDFTSQKSFPSIQLPKGSQDYVWYGEKHLISSHDGKLVISPIDKLEWKTIRNLSKFELNQVSRLALSPDLKKLAVVFVKP